MMKDPEFTGDFMARLKKHITENFIAFCPSTTYEAQNDAKMFLGADGGDCLKGWGFDQSEPSSLSGLYDIGSEAYKRLYAGAGPGEKNRPTLEELFAGFRESIELLRAAIYERVDTGQMIVVYPDGVPAGSKAVLEAENIDIIKTGRKIAKEFHAGDEIMKQFYVELLCVGCLREIDHTLVALVHNPVDAIESALIAREMLDLAKSDEVEDGIRSEVIIRRAKKAAAEKLANDPKQHAKEQVFKAWKEWADGQAKYGKRNS